MYKSLLEILVMCQEAISCQNDQGPTTNKRSTKSVAKLKPSQS